MKDVNFKPLSSLRKITKLSVILAILTLVSFVFLCLEIICIININYIFEFTSLFLLSTLIYIIKAKMVVVIAIPLIVSFVISVWRVYRYLDLFVSVEEFQSSLFAGALYYAFIPMVMSIIISVGFFLFDGVKSHFSKN